MNVSYDPGRKQALDLDSGMAVDLVDVFARDNALSFALHWKESALPLSGGFNFNSARIIAENPTFGPSELYMALLEPGVVNVDVFCHEKAARRRGFLSDADGNVLVRLLQRLVAEAMPNCSTVNVRLWVNGPWFSVGKWSVSGHVDRHDASEKRDDAEGD